MLSFRPAISSICRWNVLCRGLFFHDVPPLPPLLYWVSAAHISWHILSSLSLGAIFLLHSWIFVVLFCTVALTLTSPWPPPFCLVYCLRVLGLGWNPPYTVRNFLLLLSVFSISSFGQVNIPVGCSMTCLTICRLLGCGWLPSSLFMVVICLWDPKVFVAGLSICYGVFWLFNSFSCHQLLLDIHLATFI